MSMTLLCLSEREGLPVAIMEAMASGMVVLSPFEVVAISLLMGSTVIWLTEELFEYCKLEVETMWRLCNSLYVGQQVAEKSAFFGEVIW